MINFNLYRDTCTTGFHFHATSTPLNPVPLSLKNRKIQLNKYAVKLTCNDVKKIIDRNTSVRVDFGWSFESDKILTDTVNQSLELIKPKYEIPVYNIVSDMRCSWIGFMSMNAFEREQYENLSLYNLIAYNNEIVCFQEELIQSITSQKSFVQHAITRDKEYRYDYFKSIRNDRTELEAAFSEFVDAIKDTIMIRSIPLYLIEDSIGCHYLNCPDLFFELVSFSILKGDIDK